MDAVGTPPPKSNDALLCAGHFLLGWQDGSSGKDSVTQAAILDLVVMRFPLMTFFSTSLIDLDSFFISPRS
ncbi:MAG: hypothetical protein WCH96_03480, partial [Betaproteobacteria bacterium]